MEHAQVFSDSDFTPLLDPRHPAWEFPAVRRALAQIAVDARSASVNDSARLLSTQEAAQMLGLAEGTLYQFSSQPARRARAGFPAPARIGVGKLLWRKAELVAWAQQRIETSKDRARRNGRTPTRALKMLAALREHEYEAAPSAAGSISGVLQ